MTPAHHWAMTWGSFGTASSSVPNLARQPANQVQVWMALVWHQGHTWRIKIPLRRQGKENPTFEEENEESFGGGTECRPSKRNLFLKNYRRDVWVWGWLESLYWASGYFWRPCHRSHHWNDLRRCQLEDKVKCKLKISWFERIQGSLLRLKVLLTMNEELTLLL